MIVPIATALRQSLNEGYKVQNLKADVSAGLVVSLIALPLAMALSIAVGLPPQHGLYTAIVAGFIAALLGGSRVQVSGPTAAFVAIIAPIVTEFGLNGLIWCQMIAGGVLILMGILRLGRFIHYVPEPVTVGFTAGIAVVIATLALNDFLGLGLKEMGPHYLDKARAILTGMSGLHAPDALVGIATLLAILGFGRMTQRIPAPVFGILIGVGLALIAIKMGLSVDTIATRFSYLTAEGKTMPGIPPYLPHFALPASMDLMKIIGPALTVALLAALESLLSASVADRMTKTRHDPEAELVGIGFGNLFSGFFGGIPATGAIARTAANIHAGAHSPLASAIHALFLLLFMLALAPEISHIPMASLSALLILTAWRMAHIHHVVGILKGGDRAHQAVLIVTFFLTIFVDMVAGVGAGLILHALIHYFKKTKV